MHLREFRLVTPATEDELRTAVAEAITAKDLLRFTAEPVKTDELAVRRGDPPEQRQFALAIERVEPTDVTVVVNGYDIQTGNMVLVGPSDGKLLAQETVL